MARQLSAGVRVRTPVSGIDLARRRLLLPEGSVAYSRLVLAVGADPIRLPLEGEGAQDVLSVNDLDDYAQFRSRLEGRKRVLVLGAGLIGCEFANDLAIAGYEPTVADPADWPLSRLLPPEAGNALRDRLARAGVRWRLGESAAGVARRRGGYQVVLSSGAEVASDLLLSAVGLRPRTQLAIGAGLAVGRGIQVDRELRSSDPAVYALGDCAEIGGLVLPFVMPILHAARALARTLAGQPTALVYPAMPVVVKTPSWPTVVSSPPAGTEGTWETRVTATGARSLFRGISGELAGFALSGDAVADRNALTGQLPPLLGG
jgi:rubredoxin-NAD+ reductase